MIVYKGLLHTFSHLFLKCQENVCQGHGSTFLQRRNPSFRVSHISNVTSLVSDSSKNEDFWLHIIFYPLLHTISFFALLISLLDLVSDLLLMSPLLSVYIFFTRTSILFINSFIHLLENKTAFQANCQKSELLHMKSFENSQSAYSS